MKPQYGAIFPALVAPSSTNTLDEVTVRKRLAWLRQACAMSHEEFVLSGHHALTEGGAYSYHQLAAAVQSLGSTPNALETWLQVERLICGRRLQTYHAFLKKICAHYGIELTHQKKQLVAFKFPHQALPQATSQATLCADLVQCAFPIRRTTRNMSVSADLQAELVAWLKETEHTPPQ